MRAFKPFKIIASAVLVLRVSGTTPSGGVLGRLVDINGQENRPPDYSPNPYGDFANGRYGTRSTGEE
jgi:hypothetical protein